MTTRMFITAPEKSAIRMPWMMAPAMPTARPPPAPNAKPHTMAGMAEASYFSHVTPGMSGNSMKDSSTPIAHRSAIVTSWRVPHLLVLLMPAPGVPAALVWLMENSFPAGLR